eukprot:Tbor_TRINITY_DN5837_c1_g3::TRINITY_DN5837_c1_g3_i3::g.7332::m.7332
MIQWKPSKKPTSKTIVVAICLLFCTSVPAAAIGLFTAVHASNTEEDAKAPPPKAPDNPGWEFKLTKLPYFTNYGMLEARPKKDAKWGLVCDTDFNEASSLAACRSVGFNNITTASIGTYYEKDKVIRDNVPLYMDKIQCDPKPSADKALLEHCKYTTDTSNCRFYHDVWLQCGKNQETHVFDFKLIPEPSIGINGESRVGRLTVQTVVGGPYKDVCGSDVDDVAATAACRTLRFDVTNARKIAYKANTENPEKILSVMNDLKCPANNSGLKDCTYKLNPENHWEPYCKSPLLLDCRGPNPEAGKPSPNPKDTKAKPSSIPASIPTKATTALPIKPPSVIFT